MSDQFSGVTIVIFIACGVLTFFLLLLLSKRSITRFALKNRRGPHVPVGYNAPKSMRREIEKRLNRVPELSPEPKSLRSDRILLDPSVDENLKKTCHYYRLRAVDDMKSFEFKVREKHPSIKRRYNTSLRNYLLSSIVGSSDNNVVQKIHNVCDIYDRVRHDPKEFGEIEYNQFVTLLLELQQCTIMPTTSTDLRADAKKLQKLDFHHGHSSTFVPLASFGTQRLPFSHAEKKV